MLTRRQFLHGAVAGGAAVILPRYGAERATRTPHAAVLSAQVRDPASAAWPDLPSPDALFAYLEYSVRRLASPDPGDLGPIGSRGRALAWNWSYWGRALVFAYRATGELRFLDQFVAAFATILDQRDDRLGLVDAAKRRVIPGWGTDIAGLHLNEVAVAGLVALPLCEFLLLLRDDPDAMMRHHDLVDAYTAAAATMVWQHEDDYRLTPSGGHYVDPVARTIEPFNHTHALGAAFVHLSVLTGEPRYRTKIDELSAFFLSSVTVEENGSWSWPYVSSPRSALGPPAETIWKAGTTIEFPAAAIRHGVALVDCLEPLSVTLRQNILRPDGINEWITSRRTCLLGQEFAGTNLAGAAFAPWFLMPDRGGRHRVALLERMHRQPEQFPHGWLGGARGLAMAAAFLLGARSA